MPELVSRHLLSGYTCCPPQNDVKILLECPPGSIEPQQIITCHARRVSLQTFFGWSGGMNVSKLRHAANHV